jgi:outer membrane protein TolC
MNRLVCALTVGVALAASALAAAQHVPGAPGSLTLGQALLRAEASGTVAASQVRVAALRDAASRVPGWLNPSLELRSENWGSDADLPLDGFIVASQALELFGTRPARRDAVLAEAEEAVATARLVRRDAIVDVARTFLQVLLLRDTRAILAEQRAGLADIVRALRERVTEGVAPEADLRKFDAELATVDIESMRLGVALTQAVGLLSARVGLPGLAAEDLTPEVADIEVPAVGDHEWDMAIERRADVAAAQARHARARNALNLARARGRPDVQVVGGLKRTSGFNTGVAAVLLPVPLTDRNQVAVARESGEVRATALELETIRALARAEGRAAVASAALLRDRVQTTGPRLIEPATIVRDAARAAFREGSFDPLRLVDAERVWTEARRTQVALVAQAALAAIDARLALGLEALP